MNKELFLIDRSKKREREKQRAKETKFRVYIKFGSGKKNKEENEDNF